MPSHLLERVLSISHPVIQVIRRMYPRSFSQKCEQLYLRLLQAYQIIPLDLEVHGVIITMSNKCYGGSADVHIGRFGGMKVAVKAPRLYQANRRQIMADLINEFMIMDSLGPHPNIINFMGISCDQDIGPAIITSWMDHGTLTDIIRLKPPYEYRRRLVGQIVDGMSFLKAFNVVHGDLKSGNILIAQDGRACIADFGLSHFARTLDSSPPTVSSVLRIAAATFSWVSPIPPFFYSATHADAGSPRWMAPERLHPDKWGIISARATFQSDVFGLGMVLYETYSGNVPYHDSNDNMAIVSIVQGKRPNRPIFIPDSLWCLTVRCWAQNPFLRPSIDTVQRAFNAPEPVLEDTRAAVDKCEESLRG